MQHVVKHKLGSTVADIGPYFILISIKEGIKKMFAHIQKKATNKKALSIGQALSQAETYHSMLVTRS